MTTVDWKLRAQKAEGKLRNLRKEAVARIAELKDDYGFDESQLNDYPEDDWGVVTRTAWGRFQELMYFRERL